MCQQNNRRASSLLRCVMKRWFELRPSSVFQSPLQRVKGQRFILRKLIKPISWRPSLMPPRNNHHMDLLFNFDPASYFSPSALQSHANLCTVVTSILCRVKRRRAASQTTGNKWHACPPVLWYAYLSLHGQMYINHRTEWDSKLMRLRVSGSWRRRQGEATVCQVSAPWTASHVTPAPLWRNAQLQGICPAVRQRAELLKRWECKGKYCFSCFGPSFILDITL